MDEFKAIREPFNGTNLDVWKFQVELLLWKEGILEHITTNAPVQRNRSEDWIRADSKAMFILANNIADELVGVVTGCDTARSMYQSLCSTFGKEAELRVVDLRDERFEMRYNPDSKLNEYLVKFKKTACTMRSNPSTSVNFKATTYPID